MVESQNKLYKNRKKVFSLCFYCFKTFHVRLLSGSSVLWVEDAVLPAGISWQDKITMLRGKMTERKISWFVATALDEIACTLSCINFEIFLSFELMPWWKERPGEGREPNNKTHSVSSLSFIYLFFVQA